MIRAIEIVEATGAPIEPLERVSPEWSWQAVGLDWPREALYGRSDARSERMYAAGLVEETRDLIARYGSDFDALRSIGYDEAARVVAGDWDVATALERTRRGNPPPDPPAGDVVPPRRRAHRLARRRGPRGGARRG